MANSLAGTARPAQIFKFRTVFELSHHHAALARATLDIWQPFGGVTDVSQASGPKL